MPEIKTEIRVIGWDDAPFSFGDRETLLIGIITRGGSWVDGALAAKIEVDGLDSTEKIAKAINESGHREQLRVIMLNGITFGGFNIVDLPELNKLTGMPVIAVVRKKPDIKSMHKALGRLQDKTKRIRLIKKAGKVESVEIKRRTFKELYYQRAGIGKHEAQELLKLTCTRSLTPEPVRVAHIICSGFKAGVK